MHIKQVSINYKDLKSGSWINITYLARVKMAFVKAISALETYRNTLFSWTDMWIKVIWLAGVTHLEFILDWQKVFAKVSQQRLLKMVQRLLKMVQMKACVTDSSKARE